MGVIREISTEISKTVKELTKVSSELIEKQKSQNELRVLKKNKQKAYTSLGKRVFALCDEGKELNKEELNDIIVQIKNINEVIKNVRLEMDEREKQAKKEKEVAEFEYEASEVKACDDVKDAEEGLEDVIH